MKPFRLARSLVFTGAIAGTLLGGCAKEARQIASDQPQTAPTAPADQRARFYDPNFYQASQGGRYFTWYGCGNCHGQGAHGAADLTQGRDRALPWLYAAIASDHPEAHPGYATRIPAEQIWQIAAYLRDLPRHDPAFNRRTALDQQGEPQGSQWQGPLR